MVEFLVRLEVEEQEQVQEQVEVEEQLMEVKVEEQVKEVEMHTCSRWTAGRGRTGCCACCWGW